MSRNAPVVVRKGGFFSSLVLGLFGTIAVVVICAAAVVIYGMNLVDRKFDHVVRLAPEMLHTLEDWQSFLPPVFSDALRDRRDPAYRDKVELSVDFLFDDRGAGRAAVLTINNNGRETISLLGVRLVVENDAGAPIRDWVEYPVTPLALEHEWPGPLLPDSDRRIRLHGPPSDSLTHHLRAEIVELRTWINPDTPAERAVSAPERSPIPRGQPRASDEPAAPLHADSADDAAPLETDPGLTPGDDAKSDSGPAVDAEPEATPQPDAAPPEPTRSTEPPSSTDHAEK